MYLFAIVLVLALDELNVGSSHFLPVKLSKGDSYVRKLEILHEKNNYYSNFDKLRFSIHLTIQIALYRIICLWLILQSQYL